LEFIEELKKMGIASIYISHQFHHIYPIANRFVVLTRGEKILDISKSKTSIEELTDAIIE